MNRRKLITLLGAASCSIGIIVLLGLMRPLSAQQGQAQVLTFALIGDLGYVPSEEAGLANVLAELNNDSALSFVVHVGDLSSPRYGCTDEMQARRLAQFNALPHPLIYTPGDNEWTDCHEGQNIKGFDPLERLAKLRTIFFQGEQSLGRRTISLTRQSRDPDFAKYRENVRWDLGGVTFVTLHVPGSNNGLGRSPEGDVEFTERNKANMAWLRQAFAYAQTNNSRAVMVMQQANMFPEMPPFSGKPRIPSGYSDLRALLEREAAAFQRPVILVNGDSHYFRIDNPFRKDAPPGQRPPPSLENFLRVETFGTPNHHWLHVTVEPNNPSVFVFRPRIVSANVTKRN